MITGLAILDKMIWDNPVSTYLLFILLVIFGIVFIKLTAKSFDYIFKKLEDKIKRYAVLFHILRNPEPILFIIFVGILRNSAKVFQTSTAVAVVIEKLTFSLYVLFTAWFIIKVLITVIEKYLGKFAAGNDQIKRYDYLKPLIKTLIKIFVLAIAILLIISNLGYNVNGLIAGLGIGGIAVAFAAKELLENFFSGIVIYTERPLKVGDLIKADDGIVFGTVQEIGIRTTKVRTFDGTIQTVPNSKLSGTTLENISLMPGRRIVATLSLSNKSTAEQIEKAKKIIEHTIHKKQKTRELMEEYHIFFDKFSAFSMDITYVIWINRNLDYWDQMLVKDAVNSEILKELNKAKIELANIRA
ncbi:MAG TPA: mechanosensitive ion channel family protein [Candidatus Diapherotrites archaeon]|nr:mechanosensitive ion channel family protein [Candidatus Diapherotrites archaeon]